LFSAALPRDAHLGACTDSDRGPTVRGCTRLWLMCQGISGRLCRLFHCHRLLISVAFNPPSSIPAPYFCRTQLHSTQLNSILNQRTRHGRGR
jgi:hypothetical protein